MYMVWSGIEIEKFVCDFIIVRKFMIWYFNLIFMVNMVIIILIYMREGSVIMIW